MELPPTMVNLPVLPFLFREFGCSNDYEGLDQHLHCSSSRQSYLPLYVSQLTQEPPLVFLTHASEYIEGAQKITFFARIEKCGEFYYTQFIVGDFVTKDHFTLENLTDTLDEALNMCKWWSDKIGAFEPQILTFDKIYDEDFIQKHVNDWL